MGLFYTANKFVCPGRSKNLYIRKNNCQAYSVIASETNLRPFPLFSKLRLEICSVNTSLIASRSSATVFTLEIVFLTPSPKSARITKSPVLKKKIPLNNYHHNQGYNQKYYYLIHQLQQIQDIC